MVSKFENHIHFYKGLRSKATGNLLDGSSSIRVGSSYTMGSLMRHHPKLLELSNR